MNKRKMLNFIVFSMLILAIACQPEEPECIPSGKKNIVEVEKTPIPKNQLKRIQEKQDYCKACARSASGFFSCQTAWAKDNEPREQLRERAKQKACTDAGYAAGACPAGAVLIQQCKGEEKEVKPTALSNAMKDLLNKQMTATQPKQETQESSKTGDASTPVLSE